MYHASFLIAVKKPGFHLKLYTKNYNQFYAKSIPFSANL